MSDEKALKIPRYNVLVVDDEEAVRRLVVTLLSQRGHQCFQAADGADALNRAAANKFDAVVTDIVMPQMDGIALTKELLKRNPKLPIMVMTGHEFSSVTAVAAGAKEFIKKPFSPTEFALRFQKMMSDYELLLEIEAKQRELVFQIQKKAAEKVTDLEREIENLKNRLFAGYPRFNR
jgi:two-component system, OmpR family, response regulator ResD